MNDETLRETPPHLDDASDHVVEPTEDGRVTAAHLELTREVVDDLDRALASLAGAFVIPHIAHLARAAAPHVSESTRDAILRALDAAESTTAKWTARYTVPSGEVRLSESEVPGEITLEERGSFAFESGAIRRRIRISDGVLDLCRWLAFVPAVHAMYARSGAEKTVARLSSANFDLDDALLDAFAEEMATWARENDPALELSATALP